MQENEPNPRFGDDALSLAGPRQGSPRDLLQPIAQPDTRKRDAGYLPVSIFRLMWNVFLLSKELMFFTGLFLPLLSAHSS
jgi:hypothetical protein